LKTSDANFPTLKSLKLETALISQGLSNDLVIYITVD